MKNIKNKFWTSDFTKNVVHFIDAHSYSLESLFNVNEGLEFFKFNNNLKNISLFTSGEKVMKDKFALKYPWSKKELNFVDIEIVRDYYFKGSTLRMANIQEYINATNEIIEYFKSKGSTNPTINFYSVFSDSKNIIHKDDYDVFVIQLKGNKKWNIYTDEIKKKNQPKRTLNISKGDILYIPKGIYHSTYTVDKPSTHLTVAFKK